MGFNSMFMLKVLLSLALNLACSDATACRGWSKDGKMVMETGFECDKFDPCPGDGDPLCTTCLGKKMIYMRCRTCDFSGKKQQWFGNNGILPCPDCKKSG